jgi:hypothetical protein
MSRVTRFMTPRREGADTSKKGEDDEPGWRTTEGKEKQKGNETYDR